jgi:Protein kinase domain
MDNRDNRIGGFGDDGGDQRRNNRDDHHNNQNHAHFRSNAGVVSDDEDLAHTTRAGYAHGRRNIRDEHNASERPSNIHYHPDDRFDHQHHESNNQDQDNDDDDTERHFEGKDGSMIGDYRVLKEVGKGTFGRVVQCLDTRRHRHASRSQRPSDDIVAIKVVRNIKRYYDSALIEADIVKGVNQRGGRGITHCAIMHDTFSYHGHFCMVFESLGPSLYDFLKKQMNFQPFPVSYVRSFAKQLLETVEFLHG